MVKKDLLMWSKPIPAFRLMLSSFLLIVLSHTVSSQVQLTCGGSVQVSLDGDCSALITPEMIIQGNLANYAPPYKVRVSGIAPTVPYSHPVIHAVGNYTVTVTNSQGNSCWGYMKVEDKLAPQVDCNCPVGNDDEDCIFKCTDEAAFILGTLNYPRPSVVENCGNFTTTYYDETSNTSCGTKKIRRWWKFKDASGNESTCQSEYTFGAVSIADVIPAYNNIQMTCAADVSPAGIFAFFKAKLFAQYKALYLTRVPFVYANNDIAVAAADRDAILEATKHAWPTINGVPISGQTCNLIAGKGDTELVVCAASCTNSKKIIRIWTILDWCSGTNTPMTQIIKATDEEAPTVTGKPIVVTSVDPWTCAANFLMPAPDVLHDNCSIDVSYTLEGPHGITITKDAATGRYHVIGAPKGDNSFRYVAKDCCGNEGIFDFILRVEDRTAPIAIAKQNIVLSLTTGGQGEGIAKLFGNSVDNGSYDSCTPVKIELRRERGSNRDETDCGHTGNFTYNADGHPQDGSSNPLSPSYDDDNGAYVKFCCSDISNREGATPFGVVKVWMRVWDDGDLNGVFGTAGDNYNETWVDVRVEDKLTPKIICPADVVINCDDDDKDFNKVGKATAFSNCLNLETEYTDQNFVNSCNVGYILRTWSIKNRPGITCTQRITKRNPYPQLEATIVWPADIVTNCATSSANDKPTWSAGTCDQIGVSLKSDTFYFESGACMKILNKWTVINWCTYRPNDAEPIGYYSHTSIIKVVDDVKPTLGACNDLMFEINDFGDADADGNRCETKNLMLTKIADDQGQCASAWLKWVAIVDLWGDGKYDYEYSSFLPSSDATFDDTNGNGIPDRYVSATGRGGEFKITIPEDITGSMSTHKVIWKVADGCGNITTCTQNFMVVDKKKPTPYCLNVSSALMQNGRVELWAVDFNVGSFDNCTAKDKLLFTLNGEHPVLTKLAQIHYFKGQGQNATEAEYNAGNAQKWLPSKNSSGMIFSCDDLPVADVRMSVWDEKLNTDFCSVTLNLADNQGACGGNGTTQKTSVSGIVSTNNGMSLAGAEVKMVSGIPELTKSSPTSIDGQYTLNNALMNYNYEIGASKNDDYLNGVSTLDLVMIQRHVLGLNYFTSAYQSIAGDVNNDEKVTATDLTELRKLILGLYTTLPNNGSWKFINAGQAFADIRNPWPINEAIEIINLDHAMINQNFVSVKVGDVNNSAVGNINDNTIENRSVVALSTEDVMMSNGVSHSITFGASTDKIHGLQFTLVLNKATLNDIMIGGKKIGDNHIAQLAPNKYTVSWNTTTPVTGQEFITINVTPTKDALASEILSINSTSIGSEIYTGDDIKVSKIATKFSGRTTNNEFEVFQNEPNPFNVNTTISFNLPEAGNTTLKVYDVNGKLLYARNGSFGPGMNSFTINKSDLPSLGVMMYQIESGQFTVTKKMIGLE